MIKLEEHINYLGLKVKDRVTGFTGVVVSVAFDLYGCIQAIIHPGIDKDGKILESAWFDINRLIILDEKPVMDKPKFDFSSQSITNGDKGPEPKPLYKY